jgi:hypothetical protein
MVFLDINPLGIAPVLNWSKHRKLVPGFRLGKEKFFILPILGIGFVGKNFFRNKL